MINHNAKIYLYTNPLDTSRTEWLPFKTPLAFCFLVLSIITLVT